MSILSDNLKKARRAAGFSSQEKAAVEFKIKRSLLAAYEEGRAAPPPTLIPAIVRVYQIHDWQGFLISAEWEPTNPKMDTLNSALLLQERDEMLSRLNTISAELKKLADRC